MYCNNPRLTPFQGELYYYQQPKKMQESVCVLLDRFNSLFTQSKNNLPDIFKSVTWLVFELLDLHPFSDGNGILCKLLCSYVHSTCTPFPSSLMNNFCMPLVAARKSNKRHPSELTNLIIQSNLTSWRKLLLYSNAAQ